MARKRKTKDVDCRKCEKFSRIPIDADVRATRCPKCNGQITLLKRGHSSHRDWRELMEVFNDVCEFPVFCGANYHPWEEQRKRAKRSRMAKQAWARRKAKKAS